VYAVSLHPRHSEPFASGKGRLPEESDCNTVVRDRWTGAAFVLCAVEGLTITMSINAATAFFCHYQDVRGTQIWSFTAVLWLLFVIRFSLCERKTDATGSTMLPQAKRRLKAPPRFFCQYQDVRGCVSSIIMAVGRAALFFPSWFVFAL